MMDDYKLRGNIYRSPRRVHTFSAYEGDECEFVTKYKLGTYYTSRFIFVSNVNVPSVLYIAPIRGLMLITPPHPPIRLRPTWGFETKSMKSVKTGIKIWPNISWMSSVGPILEPSNRGVRGVSRDIRNRTIFHTLSTSTVIKWRMLRAGFSVETCCWIMAFWLFLFVNFKNWINSSCERACVSKSCKRVLTTL